MSFLFYFMLLVAGQLAAVILAVHHLLIFTCERNDTVHKDQLFINRYSDHYHSAKDLL